MPRYHAFKPIYTTSSDKFSVATKHRETKQFYTLHNTLIDMKTFMKKEVDMLNSIEDVQEL